MNNDLPWNREPANGVASISRRAAARLLLGGVSAGTILPTIIVEHPIWKHLADDAMLARTEGADPEAVEHFLNAEEFATFRALAEAIVPGSEKAQVAEFVDLLLGVDSEKNQREFRAALDTIGQTSWSKFGATFAMLTPTQKAELLPAISTNAAKSDEAKRAQSAFANVKEWIVGAYYSSEIGMRELGWTPERFFPNFQGCSHAEPHS